MLTRLTVKNFALIEDLDLEFGSGLNVLTGETGAGKSLLVEALQLGLGHRSAGETVRSGAQRATVELVFDLEQGLPGLLSETEEGFLILNRDVYRAGRSVYRVNGSAVPAGVFRETAAHLIGFHGQGEQQSLLQERRHLELLDIFGGPRQLETARAVAEAHRAYADVLKDLEAARAGLRERELRMDTLAYQLNEIDSAALVPGEETELARERLYLQNATHIRELAEQAYLLLYSGQDRQQSAIDQLDQSVRILRELARYVQEVGSLAEGLESRLYEIRDQARLLAQIRDAAEMDPGRLDVVEDRLALLEKLKRKYGPSTEDVITHRVRIAAELDALSGAEDRIAHLEKQKADLALEWQRSAEVLSDMRHEAAQRLESRVMKELRDLEMQHAAFNVVFAGGAAIAVSGRETAAFHFAPNPGEPAGPLNRIASGGEMSRVMLALLNVIAEGERTPTLVFDEVDTGVGGRALDAVAEKLADISRYHQVLCVTHSAQVASFAVRHFQISKDVAQGRTRVSVRLLDEKARLHELARMLGGKGVTQTVIEHARELLRRRDTH